MTRPELTEAMARAIYERVNGHGCRPWRQIDHKAAYRDQATAALAAIEAAGCFVVPGEPTDDMLETGRLAAKTPRLHISHIASDEARTCRIIYSAMLAASPLAKDA